MATPSSYEIKNDNVGYVTIIGQDKKEYLIPAFMLPDFLQHFEANQIKHNLNASNASGSVSSSFIFRWRAYVYPADRASGRSRIRQIAHPADRATWLILNPADNTSGVVALLTDCKHKYDTNHTFKGA